MAMAEQVPSVARLNLAAFSAVTADPPRALLSAAVYQFMVAVVAAAPIGLVSNFLPVLLILISSCCMCCGDSAATVGSVKDKAKCHVILLNFALFFSLGGLVYQILMQYVAETEGGYAPITHTKTDEYAEPSPALPSS